MTKIKICGMQRKEDIEAVNAILPDYVGYVFAKRSRRYITRDKAKELSSMLDKRIIPVGVFVNESPECIRALCEDKIIEVVQLHGNEDNDYIERLRKLTRCMIIQAVQIKTGADIVKAMESKADYILLDSGAGTGKTFDWNAIRQIDRPYFLAGGLGVEKVVEAIKELSPYGVDASSLLETDGYKDKKKMAAFIENVRKEKKHG